VHVWGDDRPAFEFAVVQVELLRDFPPVLRVEKVVSPPLVRGSLLGQHHPGDLRYPDFLLHVVAPLSTVPATRHASVPSRPTRLLPTIH
jgi:hypothetical protein